LNIINVELEMQCDLPLALVGGFHSSSALLPYHLYSGSVLRKLFFGTLGSCFIDQTQFSCGYGYPLACQHSQPCRLAEGYGCLGLYRRKYSLRKYSLGYLSMICLTCFRPNEKASFIEFLSLLLSGDFPTCFSLRPHNLLYEKFSASCHDLTNLFNSLMPSSFSFSGVGP